MTSTDAPAAATETAAETAVRAVIDGVYAAWAKGDADEFVRDYAADATATLPGTFLADRDAVHATMTAGFAGPLKGTRGVAELERVRVLGGRAAVVNSRSNVVPAGAAVPPADGWTRDTWTLVLEGGRWLVAAFHNCPAE